MIIKFFVYGDLTPNFDDISCFIKSYEKRGMYFTSSFVNLKMFRRPYKGYLGTHRCEVFV